MELWKIGHHIHFQYRFIYQHEYYLLYRGKKESFRLHCGLISDVHSTCFLTYYKIIALKKDRETNAQQVFKDLDWKVIGKCVILQNVSEGITKELDISELTDEQIITELDKIELTLGSRWMYIKWWSLYLFFIKYMLIL